MNLFQEQEKGIYIFDWNLLEETLLKFKSCNNIEVNRANITREEMSNIGDFCCHICPAIQPGGELSNCQKCPIGKSSL